MFEFVQANVTVRSAFAAMQVGLRFTDLQFNTCTRWRVLFHVVNEPSSKNSDAGDVVKLFAEATSKSQSYLPKFEAAGWQFPFDHEQHDVTVTLVFTEAASSSSSAPESYSYRFVLRSADARDITSTGVAQSKAFLLLGGDGKQHVGSGTVQVGLVKSGDGESFVHLEDARTDDLLAKRLLAVLSALDGYCKNDHAKQFDSNN